MVGNKRVGLLNEFKKVDCLIVVRVCVWPAARIVFRAKMRCLPIGKAGALGQFIGNPFPQQTDCLRIQRVRGERRHASDFRLADAPKEDGVFQKTGRDHKPFGVSQMVGRLAVENLSVPERRSDSRIPRHGRHAAGLMAAGAIGFQIGGTRYSRLCASSSKRASAGSKGAFFNGG